eukprot:TRINITY_DN17758_c0_g1_i2.p1 TRINITY_DN17758_c0_g1~~TRINITY_DN17758_c0_g1_i2.p1  ORF type:complete len:174 (-),score=47.76 TRINITY_DN17758_c0_g1_i2:114-635(-)
MLNADAVHTVDDQHSFAGRPKRTTKTKGQMKANDAMNPPRKKHKDETKAKDDTGGVREQSTMQPPQEDRRAPKCPEPEEPKKKEEEDEVEFTNVMEKGDVGASTGAKNLEVDTDPDEEGRCAEEPPPLEEDFKLRVPPASTCHLCSAACCGHFSFAAGSVCKPCWSSVIFSKR